MMKLFNGDVYDVGQTVNGISKFIYFNDRWHYYAEDMTREYEYPQEDLTKLIHDDKMNGWDEVTFLGNIFSHIEQNIVRWRNWQTHTLTRKVDIV